MIKRFKRIGVKRSETLTKAITADTPAESPSWKQCIKGMKVSPISTNWMMNLRKSRNIKISQMNRACCTISWTNLIIGISLNSLGGRRRAHHGLALNMHHQHSLGLRWESTRIGWGRKWLQRPGSLFVWFQIFFFHGEVLCLVVHVHLESGCTTL